MIGQFEFIKIMNNFFIQKNKKEFLLKIL